MIDVETRRRSHRALFVVTRATDDAAIADSIVSARTTGINVEDIWLSHPRDWRTALRAIPWLAAGCDSRGRGAVVMDGVGVLRAESFVTALTRADARFGGENIRRAMEDRVARLAASAR